MHALGLTQEQFEQVLRCCQRVLLNEFTAPEDLQHFLVARLRERAPEAAARIGQFGATEMTELRQQILVGLRSGTALATWQ